MLQSFRKLRELFNTEYVVFFIMTEYVFTCMYWPYYARKSRKIVSNFFFPRKKCPYSRFLMHWTHSAYFQRDLPSTLGVLEEAMRSSLSAALGNYSSNLTVVLVI